jgi:hypothetical protein
VMSFTLTDTLAVLHCSYCSSRSFNSTKFGIFLLSMSLWISG